MPIVGGETSGGSAIVEVANYSALPAANTVTGQLYAVIASQGTAWLPGSLGGTYYPKGLYYSDGSSWVFTETPYNATQATVDAGTNDDQFITSLTFNNSAQLANLVPYTGATQNVDLGTNDLIFGAGAGILLDNASRLREGTIDAGFGGTKGIAQICAVGYELKWEAGRLYVMDGNGVLIRHSLYNFTTVPSVNEDDTKGYYVGSLWTLDSGVSYICTDSTTAAATWDLYYDVIPNLQQVTDIDSITTNTITVGDVTAYFSELGPGAIGVQNAVAGTYSYLDASGNLGLHNGVTESSLKNTNVTNADVILEFPDKATGSYTIATIDDIPGNIVNLIRQEFTYTSGAQTFTLSNSASAVYAVFVNGQELRQSQYTVVTTTLTIIDTLEASDRVDVIYSNATLGINPSYTKAETDTLFVPYIGATSNVDLGEFELKAGQVEFDQSPTGTAGVAVMRWNDTDGTLDLGLKGGLLNKIGQQVVVRARNNSGSAITKGSVVKVVGVAGGFIGINLALGDSDANSATAFGIVAEDIADASNGFVSIQGIVHGLNTNSFTEGDVLYLSPTVAGTFTNVKPVAPQHAVVVGYVAKKSATDGHILMHVQNGYELDELHNVYINPLTLADNDVLQYESSSSLWKNKPIVTPNNSASNLFNYYNFI